MLRCGCRGNVKRMVFLGVAFLLAVELLRVSVLVGNDGEDENAAKVGSLQDQKSSGSDAGSEKIWPFDERLADGEGEDSEKSWSYDEQSPSGLDEDTERIWPFNETGLEEDIDEDDTTIQRAHGQSKKVKVKDDPVEKETDATEEKELKYLKNRHSPDDETSPDFDKLTGLHRKGHLGQDKIEMNEESADDATSKLKSSRKKTKYSKKVSGTTKANADSLGRAKALPHDIDKVRGRIGVPVKLTATQALEENKSKIKEMEQEEVIEEDESKGIMVDTPHGHRSTHTAEKSGRKSPQITKTSHGNIDSDDRIHIDTSRPVLYKHQYRYLISAPDVCRDSEVFLVCYVQSSVQNHKRRRRIRLTWANRNNYPGFEMRVVFFVGQPRLDTPDGKLVQQDLLVESEQHGDIVQEDFLDVQGNLSHKGAGALKWISRYCNHAEYVLKTDDDMFVNMYVILNHLRVLYAHANFRRRLMLCYVYWRIEVGQSAGVPKDFFPNNTYPPFCSGMGFVMTMDVALALHEVSRYVRFFALNEVFIGGVLPAALGGAVNHTSWARTYCAEYEMGIYTHPTEWFKYTFTHTHDEKLIAKTWRGLSNLARNQTIPRPSVIRPGLLADVYKPLSELFNPP